MVFNLSTSFPIQGLNLNDYSMSAIQKTLSDYSSEILNKPVYVKTGETTRTEAGNITTCTQVDFNIVNLTLNLNDPVTPEMILNLDIDFSVDRLAALLEINKNI